MPLTLKSPTVEEIRLIEADPTGDTFVRIRQATMREDIQRSAMWATASRIVRDKVAASEYELKQTINTPLVQLREAWLTMVGCNIQREDGTGLFRFRKDSAGHEVPDMTEDQFQDAWETLPQPVAEEIHRAVLAVNPNWNSLVAQGESPAS